MSASLTKILVATDFGAPAEAALCRAAALAGFFDAELVLCHVIDLQSQAYGGTLFVPLFETRSERIATATARLDELLAALADGVKGRPKLRFGAPADELVHAATNEGFDLLVLGTHGSRGLTRALLGSVAERVVRTSLVPVLTVHADA